MTIYIVTANYFGDADTNVDCADFVVDSIWYTIEDAENRVREINDAAIYPDGIFGKPYYGEIVEKKVQGKYLWISFDEWKKENDKIYEENR